MDVLKNLLKFANCKDTTIEGGGNLHNFITHISLLKNKNYPLPLKANGKACGVLTRLSVHDRINGVLGKVFSSERKKVVKQLKRWNDTARRVKELQFDVPHRISTFLLKYIPSFDHQWIEPVAHSLEQLCNPIDQISPYDMWSHYIRTREFTINEKTVEIVPGTVEKPKEFLIQLLSEFYRAFGFKVHQALLTKEIHKLVRKGKNWQDFSEDVFSGQTQKIFKQLRGGCVNVALRAHSYLNLRFEEMNDGPLQLSCQEDCNKLDFSIDPENEENWHVTHYKTYKFNAKNEVKNREKGSLDISWKVSFPRNGKWHCVLKILKVKIGPNTEEGLAKLIKYYLTSMKDDLYIEEKLSNGVIKIGHQYNSPK